MPTRKTLISLLIIGVIVIPGIGLTLFFSLGKFDAVYEGERKISNQSENLQGIDLNINIPIANTELKELPQDSTELFVVFWKIEYKKYGLFSSDQILIDITSVMDDNSRLKVSIQLEKDSRIQATDISNGSINISVNPSVERLNLSGVFKQSNFLLDLYAINFENLKLVSTSGAIELKLNRSEVSGEFSVESVEGGIDLCLDLIDVKQNLNVGTYSGLIYMDLWDLTFSSNGNVSCISTEGKINFRWMTHFRKNHAVQVLLQTSFDIEMRFWSPYELTKYKVTYQETSGRTHFGGPAGLYTKLTPLKFQSNNFGEDLDSIIVFAATFTGDIWMKFVDCFKPHRFCGLYPMEFIPSSTQGLIQIPKPEPGISEVLIYNNIEGVTMNQNWLSSSSENVVEILWRLNFTKGSDFGYGDLKIAASYETAGTQLKIAIELDYELDRIRPIINDYEISLSKHPSYSFTLVG